MDTSAHRAKYLGQPGSGQQLRGTALHGEPEGQYVGQPLPHAGRDPLQVAPARGLGPVGDEGAAEPATPGLHETLLLEGPDGLPQGDPADAEPGRQIPLRGKPLPVGHNPEFDHLEQPLDGGQARLQAFMRFSEEASKAGKTVVAERLRSETEARRVRVKAGSYASGP